MAKYVIYDSLALANAAGALLERCNEYVEASCHCSTSYGSPIVRASDGKAALVLKGEALLLYNASVDPVKTNGLDNTWNPVVANRPVNF